MGGGSPRKIEGVKRVRGRHTEPTIMNADDSKNIVKKNAEVERIKKRIQTLKRQLYSMREYESQKTGDKTKEEIALEYYKQHLEQRIKKNDTVIEAHEKRKEERIARVDLEIEALKAKHRTYEERVESEIALLRAKLRTHEEKLENDIRALESKRQYVEAETERKIDAVENDVTVVGFMKEIALRDARLMAGRPKSKAEIEKEAEIAELETALTAGLRYIDGKHKEIAEARQEHERQVEADARYERRVAEQKRKSEAVTAYNEAAKAANYALIDKDMKKYAILLEKANEAKAAMMEVCADEANKAEVKPVNELVVVKRKKKYVKQSVSDSEGEEQSNFSEETKSTTVTEIQSRQRMEYELANVEITMKLEALRERAEAAKAAEEAELAERAAEEEKRRKDAVALRNSVADRISAEKDKYKRNSENYPPALKKLIRAYDEYDTSVKRKDWEGGMPPSVKKALDALSE